MADLIRVIYVGKKPAAYDNVAKSGKVWYGHGDIQEVTPDQARQLLKFPDQWDVCSPDDYDFLGNPITTSVTGEDGKQVQVAHSALKQPLERMSKEELVALAKAKWGKDLDSKKAKKLLIDSIEEFERDLEPIAVLG